MAQPFVGLVAAGLERRSLGREVGVVGAELTGGGDVVAELAPLLPGAHDRRDLGVALVEPLGERLVGVGRRVGELLLELVALGHEPLDGLEHRLSCWDGGDTARRRPPWRVTGAESWATCRRGSLALGGLGVALLEAGDAAAGVEDLLLAGVERVALRADVGVDGAGLRGAAGGELRATGAGDLGDGVVRVDVLLHGVLSGAAGSPPRSAGCVNRNRLPSVPTPSRSRQFPER